MTHEIVKLLQPHRFLIGSETTVQNQVASVLDGAGIDYSREHRLDRKNRIDFLSGSTGIEIKIKGAKRGIYRQIKRYCAFDEVTEIVLLTGVAIGMPDQINGRPIHIVSLGAAWI
ncbi:hypothetical protein [Hoeflea poritis]|uniref:Uncharacterized protein n=1 Tax=Hoeflea poritis TaxID=2993659 RepID=A0ABT4VMT2_9HYPH|nr:hypothetical protein [Hoeflea poritis]MDA4845984.1 hypothetical protein [Hoeflea poritis]